MYNNMIITAIGRRDGLMVSAVDSGWSDFGSSSGRDHFLVVFLGERHLTLTMPLSTQEYI